MGDAIDDQAKVFFEYDGKVIEASASMADFVKARQGSKLCLRTEIPKYLPHVDKGTKYFVDDNQKCLAPTPVAPASPP
jgi:hypothetical protein